MIHCWIWIAPYRMSYWLFTQDPKMVNDFYIWWIPQICRYQSACWSRGEWRLCALQLCANVCFIVYWNVWSWKSTIWSQISARMVMILLIWLLETAWRRNISRLTSTPHNDKCESKEDSPTNLHIYTYNISSIFVHEHTTSLFIRHTATTPALIAPAITPACICDFFSSWSSMHPSH